MGKGSGSVTAFSRADGFVVIPRQQEYLEADSTVEVHLLGPRTAAGRPGRDRQPLRRRSTTCSGRMHEEGWRTKFLAVGSTGGLEAARRGECDLAGVHLLDEATHDLQPAVSHARPATRARLPPDAGHRVPAWATSLQRPERGRRRAAGVGRSRVRAGQPQPRQRHAHPDRSTPGRGAGPAATRAKHVRTTPSPQRWPRGGPTGASPSRPSPGKPAWAFSRCGRSTSIS